MKTFYKVYLKAQGDVYGPRNFLDGIRRKRKYLGRSYQDFEDIVLYCDSEETAIEKYKNKFQINDRYSYEYVQADMIREFVDSFSIIFSNRVIVEKYEEELVVVEYECAKFWNIETLMKELNANDFIEYLKDNGIATAITLEDV